MAADPITLGGAVRTVWGVFGSLFGGGGGTGTAADGRGRYWIWNDQPAFAPPAVPQPPTTPPPVWRPPTPTTPPINPTAPSRGVWTGAAVSVLGRTVGGLLGGLLWPSTVADATVPWVPPSKGPPRRTRPPPADPDDLPDWLNPEYSWTLWERLWHDLPRRLPPGPYPVNWPQPQPTPRQPRPDRRRQPRPDEPTLEPIRVPARVPVPSPVLEPIRVPARVPTPTRSTSSATTSSPSRSTARAPARARARLPLELLPLGEFFRVPARSPRPFEPLNPGPGRPVPGQPPRPRLQLPRAPSFSQIPGLTPTQSTQLQSLRQKADDCQCTETKPRRRKKACRNPVVSTRKSTEGGRKFITVKRRIECQ